jgi:hypothetical protein
VLRPAVLGRQVFLYQSTTRLRVPSETWDFLTAVAAQRIIVAGPLAIGPRLGPPAFAVAALLLALLLRRVALLWRSVVRGSREGEGRLERARPQAAAGEATSCSVLMSLKVIRAICTLFVMLLFPFPFPRSRPPQLAALELESRSHRLLYSFQIRFSTPAGPALLKTLNFSLLIRPGCSTCVRSV